MFHLRRYGKGWKRKLRNIEYYVRKLEKYKAQVRKNEPSVLGRKPVLALWFCKDDEKQEFPIETKLIDEDLETKLKDVKEKYENRVTIMYGPTRGMG